MPVDRLLKHPITLIRRLPVDGEEDSWGQPVTQDQQTSTVCHYRQVRTGDQERQTDLTVYEDVLVWLPPDADLGPYDAVELTMGTRTETMEVVGQPFAVHNARLDKINHVQLVARRAMP